MELRKHQVGPENAARLREWLETRGGLAIWPSINLSNPGASWTTPALTEKGDPYGKPTWQAAEKPERIITDINQVEVIVPKEVKRFRVAVRMGDQGFTLKVTCGATRRIDSALAKAKREYNTEDAFYAFDYMTQEAVIYVPDQTVPLADWTEEVTNA